MAWSFCTWLIPLLLALGVWRHVLHRVPLHYETSLWSMVFPVGMYGVASRELERPQDGTGWPRPRRRGVGGAGRMVGRLRRMLASPLTALQHSRNRGQQK
ncbi:hypothetical protein ACFQV4_25930 [Streptomyces thermocarboxydus]